MSGTHLSDEAVAAYADGALRGLPEQRARRHVADCPDCSNAVRVQRETAMVLRAAASPMLPTSLLSRLRELPQSAPLPPPPAGLAPDGTTLLPTDRGEPARLDPPPMQFAAAFVEQPRQRSGLFGWLRGR